MLGFGGCVETSSGLPLGGLPAVNLAQAFGILAVTLVGPPRLVHATTAFAQATARAWSAQPGRAVVMGSMMAVTHGSVVSQGTARGERANVLLGRLSTRSGKRRLY